METGHDFGFRDLGCAVRVQGNRAHHDNQPGHFLVVEIQCETNVERIQQI